MKNNKPTPCEFCTISVDDLGAQCNAPLVNQFKDRTRHAIKAIITPEGLFIEAIAGYSATDTTIKINYCPNCGRQIK